MNKPGYSFISAALILSLTAPVSAAGVVDTAVEIDVKRLWLEFSGSNMVSDIRIGDIRLTE